MHHEPARNDQLGRRWLPTVAEDGSEWHPAHDPATDQSLNAVLETLCASQPW